jgi:uncharacterized protein (DUF2062 family)
VRNGADLVTRLQRLVHDARQLRHRRWLRWVGPALHHPHVWRFSRRGVALGVGIGVFFGLLLPLGQIPASAIVAVGVRANVPAAAISTLVSNPVTFPAIYYGAYRLGARLTGQTPLQRDALIQPPEQLQDMVERPAHPDWWHRVGIPTVIGLATIAASGGVLTWFAAGWFLRFRVRRAWGQRTRRRQDDRASACEAKK